MVATWSDEDVVRKWWMLCPARKTKEGLPAEPTEFELNLLRHSVKRGVSFGDDQWTRNSPVRIGLETTTRPKGEPKEAAPILLLLFASQFARSPPTLSLRICHPVQSSMHVVAERHPQTVTVGSLPQLLFRRFESSRFSRT